MKIEFLKVFALIFYFENIENIDFWAWNLILEASDHENLCFVDVSQKSSCHDNFERAFSHLQTNRIESRLLWDDRSMYEITMKIIPDQNER